MGQMNVIRDAKNKTLTFQRVFAAPRSRVWVAWTDPEQLAKWWGPRGWTTAVKELDFRPGGHLLYMMKCEDPAQVDFYGREEWAKSVYEAIDEPNSFSYKDYFTDADGAVNEAMPTMAITMEFAEVSEGTKVTSRSVFESQEAYEQTVAMGVVEGVGQTWDRLDELLEAGSDVAENGVTITRVFDAPVEKVWAAWTDPEQIEKWWGPKDFTAPHIQTDFRVGGKYLYAMHGPAGTEFDRDMWSTGTYQEIIPLKKIVYTDSFADAKGNAVSPETYGMRGLSDVMHVTVEFKPIEGGSKTELKLTHVGAPAGSEHARNMEAGWNESLDKLAESVR